MAEWTDWKTPDTCASVDRGQTDWIDPDNAKTSNDAWAAGPLAKSASSDWLRVTNFGFAEGDIPSGSTIDGFDVKIERHADIANDICDDALYLRKTAGQEGNNKASAVKWGTSDAEITYNWTSGQFGTLDEDDVRDSGFGVDLATLNDADDITAGQVDVISVRVYYTAAAEDHRRGSFFKMF